MASAGGGGGHGRALKRSLSSVKLSEVEFVPGVHSVVGRNTEFAMEQVRSFADLELPEPLHGGPSPSQGASGAGGGEAGCQNQLALPSPGPAGGGGGGGGGGGSGGLSGNGPRRKASLHKLRVSIAAPQDEATAKKGELAKAIRERLRLNATLRSDGAARVPGTGVAHPSSSSSTSLAGHGSMDLALTKRGSSGGGGSRSRVPSPGPRGASPPPRPSQHPAHQSYSSMEARQASPSPSRPGSQQPKQQQQEQQQQQHQSSLSQLQPPKRTPLPRRCTSSFIALGRDSVPSTKLASTAPNNSRNSEDDTGSIYSPQYSAVHRRSPAWHIHAPSRPTSTTTNGSASRSRSRNGSASASARREHEGVGAASPMSVALERGRARSRGRGGAGRSRSQAFLTGLDIDDSEDSSSSPSRRHKEDVVSQQGKTAFALNTGRERAAGREAPRVANDTRCTAPDWLEQDIKGQHKLRYPHWDFGKLTPRPALMDGGEDLSAPGQYDIIWHNGVTSATPKSGIAFERAIDRTTATRGSLGHLALEAILQPEEVRNRGVIVVPGRSCAKDATRRRVTNVNDFVLEAARPSLPVAAREYHDKDNPEIAARVLHHQLTFDAHQAEKVIRSRSDICCRRFDRTLGRDRAHPGLQPRRSEAPEELAARQQHQPGSRSGSASRSASHTQASDCSAGLGGTAKEFGGTGSKSSCGGVSCGAGSTPDLRKAAVPRSDNRYLAGPQADAQMGWHVVKPTALRKCPVGSTLSTVKTFSRKGADNAGFTMKMPSPVSGVIVSRQRSFSRRSTIDGWSEDCRAF